MGIRRVSPIKEPFQSLDKLHLNSPETLNLTRCIYYVPYIGISNFMLTNLIPHYCLLFAIYPKFFNINHMLCHYNKISRILMERNGTF